MKFGNIEGDSHCTSLRPVKCLQCVNAVHWRAFERSGVASVDRFLSPGRRRIDRKRAIVILLWLVGKTN